MNVEMIEESTAETGTALSIRQSIEQIKGAVAEFEKIEAGFAKLEAAHPSNLACDVMTTKGMKEAIAGRAAWRDPRVATEKARKAGKAPVLALGRDLDARASAITERLAVGEANYDDQIKVEERRKAAEAEEKRMAEITRRERNSATLNGIRQLTFDVQGKTAAEISRAIVGLHSAEAAGFGIDADYKALEKIAIDETRAKLREMHQAAIEREAEDAARKAEAEALAKERAELARLRMEQESRDKTARNEIAAQQRAADEARAKADAEARAMRDAEEGRQRAERAEQQAKIDAERAELRKAQDEADRVAREARLAEEDRQAAERLKEAKAKREAEAVAMADRAAAARAQQEKEAAEHQARIDAQAAEAKRLADEVERERLAREAEHAADAKGRDAWADLAAVCELALSGAKLAEIKAHATAALMKAGRL